MCGYVCLCVLLCLCLSLFFVFERSLSWAGRFGFIVVLYTAPTSALSVLL